MTPVQSQKQMLCLRKNGFPVHKTPAPRSPTRIKSYQPGPSFVAEVLSTHDPDETDEDCADTHDEIAIHMQSTNENYLDNGTTSPPQDSAQILSHSSTIIWHILQCTTMHAAFGNLSRTAAPKFFKRVLIYTGAARASSGSLAEFNTYCNLPAQHGTLKDAQHSHLF